MSLPTRALKHMCSIACAVLSSLLMAMPAHAKAMVTIFAHRAHAITIKSRDIPVLPLDAPASRPTRVLAVIYLKSSGPPGLVAPDAKYWEGLFRDQAARLGADAVVGVQSLQYGSESKYELVGLAVEYPDGDAGEDTCHCVLALARPDLDFAMPDEARPTYRQTVQWMARGKLAQKGIYSVVTSATATGPGTSLPDIPALGRAVDGWFAVRVGEGRPTERRRPAESRGALQVTAPEPEYLPEIIDMRAAIVTASGDSTWTESLMRPSNSLAEAAKAFVTSIPTPQGKLGFLACELIARMQARGVSGPAASR